MEDEADGESGETMARREEEKFEPPKLVSAARRIGRRRTKCPKSLSPRLRLADMKKGGLQGSKGSPSEVVGIGLGVSGVRRSFKRNKSSLISALEAEIQCDCLGLELTLGEDGENVGKSLAIPENMEVFGEGNCAQGQGGMSGDEGLGRDWEKSSGGDNMEGSGEGVLVEVVAGKVFEVLTQREKTKESMVADMSVPWLESGDGVIMVGMNEALLLAPNETPLDLVEVDNALDLCEAQPLQCTDFLKIVDKGLERIKG